MELYDSPTAIRNGTYRLNIDGIYNIAPNNPFSCRDVGTFVQPVLYQRGKW